MPRAKKSDTVVEEVVSDDSEDLEGLLPDADDVEENVFESKDDVKEAVSAFQNQVDEVVARTEILQKYISKHMVEGEDFGTQTGWGGRKSLYKPGAEKLNSVFKVAPIVEVTNRVEDFTGEKGFCSYEVKITLISYAPETDGVRMGEGVGQANSKEKMYASRPAALLANTILKMAKKRALVDAALSNSLASGIFTQDVEDMDVEDKGSTSNYKSSTPKESSASAPAATAAPKTENKAAAVDTGDNDVIGFGIHKGLKVADVPLKNLEFYLNSAVKNVEEDTFKDKNAALARNIIKEIESRGHNFAKLPEIKSRLAAANV